MSFLCVLFECRVVVFVVVFFFCVCVCYFFFKRPAPIFYARFVQTSETIIFFFSDNCACDGIIFNLLDSSSISLWLVRTATARYILRSVIILKRAVMFANTKVFLIAYNYVHGLAEAMKLMDGKAFTLLQ